MPSTPAVRESSALPASQPDGSYAYKAFTAVDKGIGEFLSVVRRGGLVRCFSYNGLVEIAHDGEFGTQVWLVFSFGPVVTIIGRNLSALALGLCFRRIESITEFDGARWPEPKDQSEPLVQKIEIATKDMADAFGQLER
jgi:hypothetical protein